MNKTTMMKGLGAAMAVGGTIAAVGASMTGKNAAKRKRECSFIILPKNKCVSKEAAT